MKRLVLTLLSCALLLIPALCNGNSNSFSYSFVQMADPQIGMTIYSNDLARFRQAVLQINSLKHAFVVICGDLVDKASSNSFADFSAARAELAVPSYCVPGNHDIGYEPDKKSLVLYRSQIGRDYYTFSFSNDLFVCANSQFWKAPPDDESRVHDRWFKKIMADATNVPFRIFVVMHYPPFTDRPDEKEHMFNLPSDARQRVLNACGKAGVTALLVGHAHRTITNQYSSCMIVAPETTSVNADKRPFGFRLWHVGPGTNISHEFVPLK